MEVVGANVKISIFEHVHYTLGSLSQVIRDGFPKEGFMDAVTWICPCMTALTILAFKLIKGLKGSADLDFKQK